MNGGPQAGLGRVRRQLAQDRDPLFHVQPLEAADLPPRGFRHIGQFPGLHGDQVGLAEREADVPAQQRVQSLLRVSSGGRAAAPLFEQPLADIEQHLRQDGFLAGKVPVDPGARHSGGRPDVVDGNAAEAALREQGGRRGEDLLAPLLAARAYRAPTLWRRSGLGARRGTAGTHLPILDALS